MDRTGSAEPLSALDAAFLFFERAEQPLVVACVAELDQAIDPSALLESLERLLSQFPRFRQRPVRTPLDFDRPAWEDDPDFAWIHHFQTVPWPKGGLGEVLEPVLSRTLPSGRSPWEIVSIPDGPGGRAAVVLRAHHCMLDGLSGMRVLELLSEPATPSAARKPPRSKRARGPSWGNPFEAGAPASVVWDHVRDVAELTSTAVSVLHEAPARETTLNGALTSRRRAVWALFDDEDYGAICAETGSTRNEVALSVIAGALRRFLWRHDRGASRSPLRGLVPVSLRAGADTESLGNHISATLPRLPVDRPDPLDRLEWVSAEMRELRSRGQPRAIAYGLRMMGTLPTTLEALLPALLPPTPLVNTVCTNVPGPREARTLGGSSIQAVHGIVPLLHQVGVGFTIVPQARGVSICAHLDPTLVPNGDELEADLHAAFRQLRRAEKRTRAARREMKRLGALLRPKKPGQGKKRESSTRRRAPRR